MTSLTVRLITASLAAALCFGCSDRDRELARRTGDGSDTFKYKAPDGTGPASKPETPKPPAKDGSETFHYKPDARGFPTPPSGK